MPTRQFIDLPTFLDNHYDAELCARVARREQPRIEDMMDAGDIHRQVLAMNFGLAVPGGVVTIFEAIFGHLPRSKWEHPFDRIAAGKNLISARTWQLSRLIQEFQPDQLVKGDTEFWGNWMHWPILVSCSAVKPWFDTAFATAAGSMVLAELEQILFDVYNMTATEAGLVTGDGSTLPIFKEPSWVLQRLEDLVADEPDSIVIDRPDAEASTTRQRGRQGSDTYSIGDVGSGEDQGIQGSGGGPVDFSQLRSEDPNRP